MIAQTAELPPEKVTVHTTLMGGGFGRRYQADFVMEAAQIGKKLGKPVMVVWTREDDLQHDFCPASYHKCKGRSTRKASLTAGNISSSTSIAAKWHADEDKSRNPGVWHAVTIPYATKNLRIEYTLAHSSAPRAWSRSVESSSSGFVVESFVDELARVAGEDPLAFRLKLIGDSRTTPNLMIRIRLLSIRRD